MWILEDLQNTVQGALASREIGNGSVGARESVWALLGRPKIVQRILKVRSDTTRKGNIMPKNLVPKNIDQLLAEAEDLIQKINSDAIKDMKKEHRLQFEKHSQNPEKDQS